MGSNRSISPAAAPPHSEVLAAWNARGGVFETDAFCAEKGAADGTGLRLSAEADVGVAGFREGLWPTLLFLAVPVPPPPRSAKLSLLRFGVLEEELGI